MEAPAPRRHVHLSLPCILPASPVYFLWLAVHSERLDWTLVGMQLALTMRILLPEAPRLGRRAVRGGSPWERWWLALRPQLAEGRHMT